MYTFTVLARTFVCVCVHVCLCECVCLSLCLSDSLCWWGSAKVSFYPFCADNQLLIKVMFDDMV